MIIFSCVSVCFRDEHVPYPMGGNKSGFSSDCDAECTWSWYSFGSSCDCGAFRYLISFRLNFICLKKIQKGGTPQPTIKIPCLGNNIFYNIIFFFKFRIWNCLILIEMLVSYCCLQYKFKKWQQPCVVLNRSMELVMSHYLLSSLSLAKLLPLNYYFFPIYLF